MSEENEAKPARQVLLTNDQFEINENGEVVIKSDEVAEALKAQLAVAKSIEAGTTHPISIGGPIISV